MNTKNLTEDQILDLIDNDTLMLGGCRGCVRDRDRDRDYDRNRDRDRDSDRSRNTIDEILNEDSSEIIGQTIDIYGNNIIFDE